LDIPFKHPWRLVLSSPKACAIILRVPVVLFPSFSAGNFVLVLSYTVTLRYCNCCADDNTSPGNYGYPTFFL
jgi:hypothetical protein